jgi:tetratricopeptide (TPR) repeat protein
MNKVKLIFLSHFIFFSILSCASNQLKKGQEYYNDGNCSSAFEYFNMAPEDYQKNKILSRGMIESATCLARQKKQKALDLYEDAIEMKNYKRWNQALTYFEKASLEMNKAIELYNKAYNYAGYNENYSKKDIYNKIKELELWNNKYLNEIEKTEDNRFAEIGMEYLAKNMFEQALSYFAKINSGNLKHHLKQILKEKKIDYLKENAKLAADNKNFSRSMFLYEQVISILKEENYEQRKKIQIQLINTLCQAVTYYTNLKDWLKTQAYINKLDSLSSLNIYTEKIKKIYDEYRTSYQAFRVHECKNMIRGGRFQEALTLLKILIDEKNVEALRIFNKLDKFQNAVNDAVETANAEYKNIVANNPYRINPQTVCSINKINIGELKTEAGVDEIKKWLSEQDIELKNYKSDLISVLRPHYSIDNNKSDAELCGVLFISILNKEKWVIVMNMWLENSKKERIFYKIERLITGRFNIFDKWGDVRKEQLEILKASVNSLYSKIYKHFIPYGRCENKMIINIAMRKLSSFYNNTLSPEDKRTLRMMVNKKVQPVRKKNIEIEKTPTRNKYTTMMSL